MVRCDQGLIEIGMHVTIEKNVIIKPPVQFNSLYAARAHLARFFALVENRCSCS